MRSPPFGPVLLSPDPMTRYKRGRRNWEPPTPLAPSVNSTIIQQSPDYRVKELGRILPRLLAIMISVPPEQIILFAKIDLSNGFWRMFDSYMEPQGVVWRQSSPAADRAWQMSAV